MEGLAQFAGEANSWTVGFVTFDEKTWLGPNYTWASLRDESGGRLKPQPWHFLYVLLFTVLALLVRKLFDQILFLPLGRLLKVSEVMPTPPIPNAIAEKLHKSGKRPSKELIASTADACGWTELKLQRWLKRRRAANDRSKMPKFQEACWRCLGYSSLLVFGYWALKDTIYFMNTRECWIGYEDRTIPIRVFWYYMLELGFYSSLTVSHFSDTKRKDFWEMLIHHVATIVLVAFSYHSKLIPIGSLIMFVHDIADPWLEVAKALGYTRVQSSSGSGRSWAQICVEVCFVVFAISFWITRLYVYPRYLIYSVWVESNEEIGNWPMQNLFLSLLNLLFVLHVFWSYLIVQVVSKAFKEGQVGGDSRSDDEGDDIADEVVPANGKHPVATDAASAVRQRPTATHGNNGASN